MASSPPARRRATNLQRLADRYLGIPLLALLGAGRKRPMPMQGSVRRIGVLKSSAIGDTLLLAGLFDGLKTRYPAARLFLITGSDNAGAARLLGSAVDEHVVIAARTPLKAIRALRRLELDVILDCGPWPRVDALIAGLSGARYRVGFRVPGQARHALFDRVVAHRSDVHQLENFRNLARAIGADDFPAPAIRRPGKLPPERVPSSPFMVFHPWSGGYMGWVKEWPLDRWIELGKRLNQVEPITIVITGGPDDSARTSALANALASHHIPVVDAAGRYDLADLADLLGAARCVVSVNTGVMHLAALAGAPTVSLEGPVPVCRWGPIGPHVRSVESTLPGCGYLDLGFEYSGRRLDCMDGVSVDAVLSAIRELRSR